VGKNNVLNKKFATSYPLAKNTFSSEEIEAAKQVLDSNSFTMGERVREFEKEFAAWTGAKHALMVNSGSSANLLAIEALVRPAKGEALLSPGDEVIVPALAWPTTVWPLVQLGLVPVFVDINPVTLATDLESIEKSLSPKTKGIFLIHVLGRIADMKPLVQFCQKRKIVIIEDVCESLGAHEEVATSVLIGTRRESTRIVMILFLERWICEIFIPASCRKRR
jgi:CDP-6-deoxy-D-xylo-4-hexulose-3-dehydrase